MASVQRLGQILQGRHLITSRMAYCYSAVSNIKHNASYSTKKVVTKIEPVTEENKMQVSTTEKVTRNIKSAGYLGVIIAGVGITGAILYTLFSELFSSNSPYGVFSRARVCCMEHPKVVDLLGAPLKAYGEETRRGRRRHINHMYYIKNGIKYMRIQFYIEGTRRRGTAYVDVKESSSGNYEYVYMCVVVNNIGTIIIEDNRNSVATQENPESKLDFM
ncbi:mitochondrial import inner membrane translocase subunit Tim21 [Pseudomyrmex gracilis]|uniref:mitochondrial import inner membrane translocase subunit Tim21 n=1 Tax=Pseudomyrmex gracilis TaxID=219809 RepID=UPI000995218D|nr:mitochondrial import inner membrane translocase subunit Tim21 [Pseudomyrmex gracilis]